MDRILETFVSFVIELKMLIRFVHAQMKVELLYKFQFQGCMKVTFNMQYQVASTFRKFMEIDTKSKW